VLNWMELPDLVEFANKNNLHTFYNTVWQPDHISVRSRKPKEIKAIVEFLQAKRFEPTSALHQLNISRYNDVIQTFSYWYDHSADPFGGGATFIHTRYQDFIQHLPTAKAERDITLLVIRENMDIVDTKIDAEIELFVETELNSRYERNEPLWQSLQKLSAEYLPLEYLLANNAALLALAKIGFNGKIDIPKFSEKIDLINQKMKAADSYESLMRRVISGHPIRQILSIDRNTPDQLMARMK
jgi:hypothetical protein